MKNRKIVIPLFIILIISFVTMIFFYVYKKHNDKVKLEEEKRLNEKIIKEKEQMVTPYTKFYSIYSNAKTIEEEKEHEKESELEKSNTKELTNSEEKQISKGKEKVLVKRKKRR